MSTLNIEISSNHGPVNITKNLDNEKFYTVQTDFAFGRCRPYYILVDGTAYPDAPPKIAHLLKNHAHMQIKVKASRVSVGLDRGGMCSSG